MLQVLTLVPKTRQKKKKMEASSFLWVATWRETNNEKALGKKKEQF